jgi:hypothetical protein
MLPLLWNVSIIGCQVGSDGCTQSSMPICGQLQYLGNVMLIPSTRHTRASICEGQRTQHHRFPATARHRIFIQITIHQGPAAGTVLFGTRMAGSLPRIGNRNQREVRLGLEIGTYVLCRLGRQGPSKIWALTRPQPPLSTK